LPARCRPARAAERLDQSDLHADHVFTDVAEDDDRPFAVQHYEGKAVGVAEP
jgi:hypothetical protein